MTQRYQQTSRSFCQLPQPPSVSSGGLLIMMCRHSLLVLLMTSLKLGKSLESGSSLTSSQTLQEIQSGMGKLRQDMESMLERLKQMEKAVISIGGSTTNSPESGRQPGKVFTLFISEMKNWNESYEDCLQKNMSLASIESEEEYQNLLNQILALAKRTSDFWLSGTDFGHIGVFEWFSTGRIMTYHKWASSKPSNPNSDCTSNNTCVEINQRLGNEMNNYCCSNRQYYVCEYRREIERNLTDKLYYPED